MPAAVRTDPVHRMIQAEFDKIPRHEIVVVCRGEEIFHRIVTCRRAKDATVFHQAAPIRVIQQPFEPSESWAAVLCGTILGFPVRRPGRGPYTGTRAHFMSRYASPGPSPYQLTWRNVFVQSRRIPKARQSRKILRRGLTNSHDKVPYRSTSYWFAVDTGFPHHNKQHGVPNKHRFGFRLRFRARFVLQPQSIITAAFQSSRRIRSLSINARNSDTRGPAG